MQLRQGDECLVAQEKGALARQLCHELGEQLVGRDGHVGLELERGAGRVGLEASEGRRLGGERVAQQDDVAAVVVVEELLVEDVLQNEIPLLNLHAVLAPGIAIRY